MVIYKKIVSEYTSYCQNLSNRNISIDIAKGIGILLVVLGHYEVNSGFGRWIFSFHMPLFILLSGYVWKESLNNIKSMVISWMIAGMLGSFLLFIKEQSLSLLGSQLLGILFGSSAPYYRLELNPAIWFVSCLICIQLFDFVLSKIVFIKVWGRIVITVLIIIVGMIMSNYKNQSYVPWNVDVACLLYPFFLIGKYLKTRCCKIFEKFNIFFILAISMLLLNSLIVLMDINGAVNIYRMKYGNSISLYYINGLIGSIGVLGVSYCLKEFKNMKWLGFIGGQTMFIMYYHQIGTMICIKLVKIFKEIVCDNIYILFVVKYGLFFALIGVLVISSIVIKEYFPIILGNKFVKKKEN